MIHTYPNVSLAQPKIEFVHQLSLLVGWTLKGGPGGGGTAVRDSRAISFIVAATAPCAPLVILVLLDDSAGERVHLAALLLHRGLLLLERGLRLVVVPRHESDNAAHGPGLFCWAHNK